MTDAIETWILYGLVTVALLVGCIVFGPVWLKWLAGSVLGFLILVAVGVTVWVAFIVEDW